MKNEKMLEKLHEVLQMLPPEHQKLADTMLEKPEMYSKVMPGISATITDLIKELHEDIKKESAKSSGASVMKKAADNILRQCADMEHYGAFIIDGLQIVGGRYSAVRLSKPLPLCRDFPEDMNKPPYNTFVINASKNEGAPLMLPSRQELSAHIKIEKAKHKGEKGFKPIYDFGEGRPLVNAVFLLEIIDILGADTVATMSARGSLSPIYFKSEAGDGILCPINRRYNPR